MKTKAKEKISCLNYIDDAATDDLTNSVILAEYCGDDWRRERLRLLIAHLEGRSKEIVDNIMFVEDLDGNLKVWLSPRLDNGSNMINADLLTKISNAVVGYWHGSIFGDGGGDVGIGFGLPSWSIRPRTAKDWHDVNIVAR